MRTPAIQRIIGDSSSTFQPATLTALTTTGTTTHLPPHLQLHQRLKQTSQHWLPNSKNASLLRQHQAQVQLALLEITSELTSSLSTEQITALTEGLQALASSSPSEM